MNKTTNQIRQDFLNFFKKKGHVILPSSSLIPHDDSTLLFTNAGMNQFKNIFLGKQKRIYPRVTTAQHCLRTGGKHNDLENVGNTTRHHTFFEMLGNFSFYDYFKKEAIMYAWELLTSPKWFNIPNDKLWVSVYQDDDETFHIWKNIIKVPLEKIIKIGDKINSQYDSENFWKMGNTGPCGPCTEIFYDCDHQSNKYSTNFLENKKRFLEIWNIVFIEFNQISKNKIVSLNKKSIDTGMGLERIASILQNVSSNYNIDIFSKLIEFIAKLSQIKDLNNNSLKIIADHIRSCAFIISENIVPSNEHRGYVLRRIIRRALRHGHKIGIKEPFFYKLVPCLIEIMDTSNQIIKNKKNKIEEILKKEEIQFSYTLETGLKLLKKEIKKIKNNILDGQIAFYLYDTLGFPIDLTHDICKEYHITIDYKRYEEAQEKQRKNSSTKNKFYQNHNKFIVDDECIFKGYNQYETISLVKHIFVDNKTKREILKGQTGVIFLNETSFYHESGGQISDIGQLCNEKSFFKVESIKKYGNTVGHIGKLIKGKIIVNDKIKSIIDKDYRNSIQLNHSSTHLLNAALRKHLGEDIFQKGSLVTNKYLRFDFSYCQPLDLSDTHKIEEIVNNQIRKNILIKTKELPLEEAKQKKAIALFDTQYTSTVRVVKINNFSLELCGGTHTKKTGDIGLFKITSYSSIASGIKRIEAVTGKEAIKYIHKKDKEIQDISLILKSHTSNIKDKIKKLIIHIKNLELMQEKSNKINIISQTKKLLNIINNYKGINILIHTFQDYDRKFLKKIIQELKIHIKCGIMILVNCKKNNFTIFVYVTKNLTQRITAKKILQTFIEKVDGKGGGKDESAEGGSIKVSLLPSALNKITLWIYNQL